MALHSLASGADRMMDGAKNTAMRVVESVGEVLAREEGEAVRSDARNVDMASAQGSKRT